jgi:protein tyrosine phosphatase
MGRTGVLITLMMLARKVEKGQREFNLPRMIGKLREYRAFLVSTRSQYVFIVRELERMLEFAVVRDRIVRKESE